MIIECINCNKKFNVNDKLIPVDGRQIKCGSCNHSWHFIIEKPLEETTIIKNEDIIRDQSENKKNFELPIKIKRNKINDKNKTLKNDSNFLNDSKNQRSNNFFSYLLVFIISLIALIIVVDTLKTPLINLFPGLEIILFNLFETLKDVKLFIIDLT
ncbi:zinc-ribbon domain-containing protein [Candidatus Pelagibacter bacterium nBUS_25]|uniref:zinc-ribbon domain-containing protein n=1 Tax=Candidatus Pelagibacter bacterium nBUS_25 TaxID=3374187 RepID=UPI003EB6AA8F